MDAHACRGLLDLAGRIIRETNNEQRALLDDQSGATSWR
jgi:hypothetical protein